MSKTDNMLIISQQMQMSVKTRRTGFPVLDMDWARLRRMIESSSPKFVVWAGLSSAGLSAGLAIGLTWITVIDQPTYPYKTQLLVAASVSLTIGVMSGIFAWVKRERDVYDRDQILEEMDTMKINSSADPEVVTAVDELKILRGTYGVPENNVDVTRQLNELIVAGQLSTTASNALAGDPAPGVPKFLEVDYEVGEGHSSRKFEEGEEVKLP